MRTRQPRVKPLDQMTWRVELPAVAGVPPLVSITVGRLATWYWVESLGRGPMGRGLRFAKADCEGSDPEASEYSVLLAGMFSSCECRGFLRWGRCKHLHVAREMAAQGGS